MPSLCWTKRISKREWVFKRAQVIKEASDCNGGRAQPERRTLHSEGPIPDLVCKLLNIQVIKKLELAILANDRHHIPSVEVAVSESETSILFASLNEKDPPREICETLEKVLSVISEVSEIVGHLERRREELFEKNEDLERVPQVEEEVVFLFECTLELGSEDREKLLLVRVDEALPEVASHKEEELK